MRILSLELVRYKRMPLNNVHRFVITPTQIVQLILGTNGSGKSSLMKELTPLPADPNDYYKDGAKIIQITHRGSNYKLSSVFGAKDVHSFLKDGEELNPGGGITIQKELVRQEFGITPEIHNLLTGHELFHSMVPARRREWFTMLSDENYDYALKVFKHLKERSRDLTGALRTTKKRLVVEVSKVISPAEEEKLRNDVDLAAKELQLLMMQSAPIDRPASEYQNEQQRGLDELHRLGQRLLRMRCIAPYGATDPYSIDPRRPMERDEWRELILPVFESVADIDSLIDELRHKVTAKEAVINRAVQEHGKLNETVQLLIKTGQEGVKSLQDRMQGVRQQRNSELAKRKLGIEGINAQNAASALETIYDVLSATFLVMPENEDKRLGRGRLQVLQETLLQQKNQRIKLGNGLVDLNTRKAHMESHKANGAIACPQCKHTWTVGYDDVRYQQIVQGIETKQTEIAEIDKAIAKGEEEVTAIQEYFTQYRDYTACVRNWPALQPLWDYLDNGEYVTRSPRKALSIIDTFRIDLQHELEADKHEATIREIQQLIISAEKVGDADLADSRLKLEECAHQIDQMTAELTTLQTQVSEYTRYRNQMLEAQALEAKIRELMQHLENTNAEMIEMLRRETLSHCIRKLQHTLAIKQETLDAALRQKNLVEDLEKQIVQLTVEEEAAKLLVKELSPTDGLIAEGLLGFIRKFTSQMNLLIRKIWSYPLQVLDCGVVGSAAAELDYKFPMMVNTRDNVVKDVKEGSTGQREIVNLAFKVTAMMYLHLAESPLFLDEFGASFDEAHRNSASHAIKALMDQKPFTQLFMVSHYESSYGAFTNAEVCVLCPTNIAVPAGTNYNQHVTME